MHGRQRWYYGKHFHKNIASNLVPLCKACHNAVHQNTIEIRGYRETSSGIELDYSYITPKEKSAMNATRKKFSEEQVDMIRQVSVESKWKSQKLLQEYLEKEKNIVVSAGILRQIRAGSY